MSRLRRKFGMVFQYAALFDSMNVVENIAFPLIERYKRVDADTMEVQMTLTDPKAYTEPWVSDKITFVRAKAAIFEEICAPSEENRFNDRVRDAAVGKSKP